MHSLVGILKDCFSSNGFVLRSCGFSSSVFLKMYLRNRHVHFCLIFLLMSCSHVKASKIVGSGLKTTGCEVSWRYLQWEKLLVKGFTAMSLCFRNRTRREQWLTRLTSTGTAKCSSLTQISLQRGLPLSRVTAPLVRLPPSRSVHIQRHSISKIPKLRCFSCLFIF